MLLDTRCWEPQVGRVLVTCVSTCASQQVLFRGILIWLHWDQLAIWNIGSDGDLRLSLSFPATDAIREMSLMIPDMGVFSHKQMSSAIYRFSSVTFLSLFLFKKFFYPSLQSQQKSTRHLSVGNWQMETVSESNSTAHIISSKMAKLKSGVQGAIVLHTVSQPFPNIL